MDRCICCGAQVPEGRQVCSQCENFGAGPDVILPDGRPLYLKSSSTFAYEQAELYKKLFNKE